MARRTTDAASNAVPSGSDTKRDEARRTPSRDTVILNTLLDELKALRQRLSRLEQLSRDDPARARERLSSDVAGFRRASENLHALLTEFPARSASEASARVSSAVGDRGMEWPGHEWCSRSGEESASASATSLDAVITIDRSGCVVDFDSAAEGLFGYQREDVIGRSFVGLFVPPRMRTRALSGFSSFQVTGKSALLGKRVESRAMKADGSEFPVEMAMMAIGVEDRLTLVIHVWDATHRKRAEQEVRLYGERLRALTTDLLLAEENERRSLAFDLQYGLSQTIALMQIKLSALRLSINGQGACALDEIKALIDQSDLAVRAVSFDLSPPVLHDLGLQPALRSLVEHLQDSFGLPIRLEDDGRPKPADQKARVILFRSIREVLMNAVRHAGAERVRVRLELEGDRVKAAIEDDGIGMEPSRAAGGSGLFSIRERLRHVGGSLRVESSPGRGTRIYLCAPLHHGTPKQARIEA